ncbi:hypothetical protein CO671_01810 [Rhizobium sp. M10]|uniref:hypothetical protein n=1 Tax=Rhizobium sp. M10 TaxID=1324586 RepID=UPI000BE9FCEF|nr:hypothetical protein [Rhizobium sp. M10]PDT38158.1 hypothetical protein CO671_01810 [Rhizobium sp. M10]
MQAQGLRALCVVGACLLAAPASAEQAPLPKTQPFKLDAGTGCFNYTGSAGMFVGQFKRGAYVSVLMDNPERIPVLDAPDYKTNGPASWFGPLPKSGSYTIMFMPRYLHGSPGTVEICGRTTPPGATDFTPQEAVRLNKLADDIMENDPYSKALLEEPKTLPTEALNDKQPDVCGFRVRDVTMRAGSGADASPLQPRVAGSVKHFANLYESPFDVFAICTPSKAGQSPKTVKLPNNTKDCYFAGEKFECSYLVDGEMVPVE